MTIIYNFTGVFGKSYESVKMGFLANFQAGEGEALSGFSACETAGRPHCTTPHLQPKA